MSRLAAAAVAALFSIPAAADTLVQWNFNSPTPDNNTATGTLVPSVGAGTASLLSGTTSTFASGSTGDPATADDSGWNTSTYPSVSSGSGTRGVQFSVSTEGFENIVLTFDKRHSNTSSRWEEVLYTVDGSTWLSAGTTQTTLGDTYIARSVDLSSIAGVDDNASFAVRVVAIFAPGTGSYAATTTGSSYGTSGTWRFDYVTISGDVIPAVPEPGALALLLAGLGVIGSVARRRSA